MLKAGELGIFLSRLIQFPLSFRGNWGLGEALPRAQLLSGVFLGDQNLGLLPPHAVFLP